MGAGVEVVLAQPVLLGQDHDRAALWGLVRERGHLGGLGERRVLDTGHRQELGGLAVAERDRAGLVEEQHVHVARGLHRATGEGQDVAPHEPVHARDPDGRQQRPDGRGDERDEQRDERDHRRGGVGELGEWPQRHDHHEEDQGHARQQDPERDLVRRLAPLGALHQSDHAVEEAAARLLRDLDDDAVGEHARTAGHGAAVTAGLPDHRRRLAGDGGLVHRRDALDHRAVSRDQLAGLDHDHVAAPQLGRRLLAAVAQTGHGLGAHCPQRLGLGLAAALCQRLRQVREDDREPQPDPYGEAEPGRLVAAAQRGAAEGLDQPADRGDQQRRSRPRTSPGCGSGGAGRA